jgi:hypothetical protein
MENESEMPTYIPKHYHVEVRLFGEADRYLDKYYGQGWRVVSIVPHPDGRQIICLLEKAPPLDEG